MAMATRRICIAMSGGVDSSVAALLLSRQYPKSQLLGIHMTNWSHHDGSPCHQSQLEFQLVSKTCRLLGIECKSTSFEKEYVTEVFDPFVCKFTKNITPNPDVDCNRLIKFGKLLEFVKEIAGPDALLATGHYARLSKDNLLTEALDPKKDQSYFLSTVPSPAFNDILFPIGDLLKTGGSNSVRQIAQDADLPSKDKKDSFGICFVNESSPRSTSAEQIQAQKQPQAQPQPQSQTKTPRGEGRRFAFTNFMQDYLPPSRIDTTFIDIETNETIGNKSMIQPLFYTVGQGARIGGEKKKWFVCGKDDFNVFVCDSTHHPALYTDEILVDNFNWIAGDLDESGPFKCRVRHLQPLIDCRIKRIDDKENGGMVRVTFNRPLRGVAVGQVCCVYAAEEEGVAAGRLVVGGGEIIKNGQSYFERGKELFIYDY